MSNSRRIWIMYAVLAAMPIVFIGPPLITGLLGASDDTVGISAAVGAFTSLIG